MLRPRRDEYDLVLVNTPALDYSVIKENDQGGVPPLGLGSIANYCNVHGFKVSILDADEQKLTPEQIIKEINATKTRFVGLNAVSENIDMAYRISTAIIHPVILGGIHATLDPEDTIHKFSFLYGLIVGEGEKPMLEILSDKPKEDIPSLVYKKGDSVIINKRSEFADLSEFPFPDPDLFGKRKEYYLFTSRGCPFSCAFCASPVLYKRTVRFAPMDKVISEMVMAYQVGHTHFHFLDDQFLVTEKRAEEFISGLISSNLFGNIRWRCMARADVVLKMKEDTCRKLVESGGYLISIGIESGCQRILELVHKKTTNTMIKSAVGKLKQVGFRVKGFIILGFPDETLEEMMETKQLIMELGQIGMEYFNIAILRPYPGTEIYHSLLNKGYTPEQIFFDTPSDGGGFNKRFVHGSYNQLNDSIQIAGISNKEIREVERQIIGEFTNRFGAIMEVS
jgi:anaerobic magnesium-protoporphyrin IX monomethyl ester cyclase